MRRVDRTVGIDEMETIKSMAVVKLIKLSELVEPIRLML